MSWVGDMTADLRNCLIAPVSPSVVVRLSLVVLTQDEGSERMLLSGNAIRRTLVGVTGVGALAGAMLIGAASLAFADPRPPRPPRRLQVARRLI